MKKLILCIGFNLIISFLYASSISFDEMRRRIAYDPLGSLALLDSAGNQVACSSYQKDYLRALSYHTQSQYYMATYYVRRAFEEKELRQDSVLVHYAYMLWARSAILSFQLKEAAKVITEGEKYALQHHNVGLQGTMLQMKGDLYRKMGLFSKSYECVMKAVLLLSKPQTEDDYLLYCNSMGYLMFYYINDNQLQNAWNLGLKREEVLAAWEKRLSKDLHVLDRYKGLVYSKMAYLAYRLNKGYLSDVYAEKFYSTSFSKTQAGMLEMNTLNIVRFRTLIQSSEAYRALGDYVHAYLTMAQVYHISRQMTVSRERSQIFQLSDVTEAVAREYRLEKADYRLKVQRYAIGGLIGVALLLLGLLGGLWRALYVIRRKNRKMAELVLKMDDQRKEICDVEREQQEGTQEEEQRSDEKLFFKFDRQVKEQKLYLNYQLGRDDYVQLMGVDRNRFAAILKKYTSDNLSTYLNNLRLDYSVTLFREHPDWAINKIAEESALPRISTFYRLFKEKYGISPNSFRKTLS